jgi:hypothetical protein
VRRIPYWVLVPLAALLAAAPLGQEPHLVEKTRLLLAGDLRRPLDIFDLVLHGGPLLLLVVKGMADLRSGS